MKRAATLPLLLAAAILACPSTVAAFKDKIERVCVGDAIMKPPIALPGPIPVGCELVDCCPGCPASGPFEWRMNVDATVLTGAELRLQGLGQAQLKQLQISGNAKLEGDRIHLGRGESKIEGIPASATGKIIVGSMLPTLGKGTPRIRGTAKDVIRVEQFLGQMPINAFRWQFFITRCLVIGPPPAAPRDWLKIDQIPAGEQVSVLMDAREGTGCTNDATITSTGQTWFTNLLSQTPGCIPEVSIFGRSTEFLLRSPVPTWTDSVGDVHTETLKPLTDVDVTIWITDSAFESRARDELNNMNALYFKNQVGVRFNPTYVSVWQWADASAARTKIENGVVVVGTPPNDDYRCTDQIAQVKEQTAPVVFTPGRLNVYYVNKPLNGRNCAIKTTPTSCPGTGTPIGDGNITYLGTILGLSVLAHEIGHALGLRPGPCHGHTNGLAGFDPNTSIMYAPPADLADYFSLGQAFRMNTHDDEWEGTMLIKNGQRPKPGRNCPPWKPKPWDPEDPRCPRLSTGWPP